MQSSNDNDTDANLDRSTTSPASRTESPRHMGDPHHGRECGAWKWRENKSPFFSCVCSGNTFTRDYWTDKEALPNGPSAADIETSQAIAREHTDIIFSSWRTIHALIDEHRQTLRKRWAKRGIEARKNLLLEARPKMPKRHGDDWKAMWTKVANRDASLWPSINAEDLAQEDTAMLLLDSRANSLPSAFAQSDLESARMGIITGAIDRRKYPYLRHCTMAIEEIEEDDKEPIESRYGRIYNRKQLEAVRETAIEEGKLKKMDFIDHLWTSQPGLLVLEIQAGIMEFLQKFTILILEELDISLALEAARLLEVQPSPLIGLANDTASTKLSNVIAQAPYRVPDLMDSERLVKVVQDKVTIAEEHLWDLYENPGYFAGILTEDEVREKAAASGAAPLAKKSGAKQKAAKTRAKMDGKMESSKWNQLLRHMILDSHSCIALWKTIGQGLQQIRDLHKEYTVDIRMHFEMPLTYIVALQGFKRVLQQLQKHFVAKLCRSVPKSTSTFRLMAPPVSNPGKRTKRILPDERVSLLASVLTDAQYKNAVGLQNIQSQLDDVVRGIVDEGKRHDFSSWHLELLSDLGIVAEIDRQFRLFKHQQMASTEFYGWTSDNSNVDFADTLQLYVAAEDATEACREALEGMDLAKYGSLESGRFDYPLDKRRTQLTTQAMINAEENLDRFWAEVDVQINQCMQIAHLHHLFGLRKPRVKRTEPWTGDEPTRKSKEQAAHTLNTDDFASDLSHLHVSASTAGPARDFQAPLAPKEERKLKTRNPGDLEWVEPAEEPEPEPEELPFTTKVSRDDYEIVLALFFVPDSNPPAEIPWTGFLRFMTRIGFAVSLQRGSEWLFVPDTEICGQSMPVTFHDPHPSKKLDLWIARSNGRRLERKYGWSAKTFVEE